MADFSNIHLSSKIKFLYSRYYFCALFVLIYCHKFYTAKRCWSKAPSICFIPQIITAFYFHKTITQCTSIGGARGGVVKVLRYKPAGRGFDSQ